MDMGEKHARDWNKCRQFDLVASWTLGASVESARLAQGSKFDRGFPSPSPCKTEETGPSERKTAPTIHVALPRSSRKRSPDRV